MKSTLSMKTDYAYKLRGGKAGLGQRDAGEESLMDADNDGFDEVL